MRLLAALAVLMLAGCAMAPHKTAHRLEFDDGVCSATAVGHATLLSAEHCFKGAHSLNVDGVPVEVLDIIADGADHVLVIVSARFENIAYRGAPARMGDGVHYWGNPAGMIDLYRKGYVSGSAVSEGRAFDLVDTNGFYGDSGAGVFNDSGELVGVVSVLYQNTDHGYIKFMGMFPFKFTAEQWSKVR